MSEQLNEDAGAGEGGAGDGGAGGGTPAVRTFSQEDVDRIVRDRLARAKTDPPADYEDLKAKAARLAEIETSQLSDLEKAQTAREQAERERDAATARATEALVRSAVVAEAARKNVVDPDAAFALLDRGKLTFGEDGAPTNISDEMDSLLKAKPYLVSGGGGDPDFGARGKTDGVEQLTQADLKKMSPEQIMEAQNKGQLRDLMAGD